MSTFTNDQRSIHVIHDCDAEKKNERKKDWNMIVKSR